MLANPILLQKKYTRIVALFAEKQHMTLEQSLSFFYSSSVYDLIHEGVSDFHCMSDDYIVEDLIAEYREKL